MYGNPTTIIIIYRPEPSAKNNYKISDFFIEFTELLSYHHAQNREFIVAGDFNFHVNKPGLANSKKFLEILETFELKQHIMEPTHVAGNILDLVITRNDSMLITDITVDDLLSDHNAIIANLNLSKPRPPQKRIKFRQTRNIVTENFKIDLRHFFSSTANKLNTNLNTLIEKFEKSETVLNKHAPLTEKLITVRKPTPWNTEQILSAKRLKRKAEKKWRKSKTTIDLQLYKEKRNDFNRILSNHKSTHLANKIEQHKGNSKALFKTINSALYRKQKSPLPPHTDEKKLATELATFFNEKIENIRKKLDNRSQRKKAIPKTFTGQKLQQFEKLETDDVRKLIKDMATKHSALDPIPTWLLKDCLDEFLPIITNIVNLSLQSGIMPKSLKHAIIQPQLKKPGLELKKENFRPISNLKFLSKVVESAAIQQLQNHMSNNNLHDPRQSAYRPLHSTETLLTKIFNDIMISGNSGQVTMMVLLDLSAAFDTIDHDILIERLDKTYGIQDTALKRFKSYISDRTQSVAINNTISDTTTLKYGVPQGSKLGPVLFNAYIAPLSETAKKHNINDHKYADDEQLILSFTPNATETLTAKTRMENCIKDIRLFLSENKLCNNSEKTEIILVGPKHQMSKLNLISIKIDDIDITITDNVKNLGVIFDKHMSMDKQINKMVQSAYLNIRNISKIRKSLSKENLKTLVNALVTPHLDYGNGLLYGTPWTLIKRLNMAQNSAVRLIERLRKYDHITEKKKELHWLPIPARIEYKLITQTWKILNKKAPEYLKDLVKLKESQRNLRNSDMKLLDVPNLSTTNKWGHRAFSIASPTLWNKLPNTIRHLDSYDTFKKKLKTHLFQHHYDLLS